MGIGDFNVDLLKYNSDSGTCEFYDNLASHGFAPLILQPTRVTSSSATLIDNIFINYICCSSSGGNLTASISDHFFQFSLLGIDKNRKQHKIPKFGRNYRNFKHK